MTKKGLIPNTFVPIPAVYTPNPINAICPKLKIPVYPSVISQLDATMAKIKRHDKQMTVIAVLYNNRYQ